MTTKAIAPTLKTPVERRIQLRAARKQREKRAAIMREVAQAVAVLSMTGAIAVGLAYQAVNALAK